MKMKLFAAAVISACIVSTTFAQSPIKGSEPNIQLRPIKVEASSAFPPEGDISYVPENLLDLKDDTAWFNLREDTKPWVAFSFSQPVRIQAMIVKNGWQKDINNWSYNRRAKDLDIAFSDGYRFAWTLRDDQSTQIVPGSSTSTRSVKFSILSPYTTNSLTGAPTKYAEIGLTEIGLMGRIPDEKAIIFRDMAKCTLEFQQALTIAPNKTRATELRSDPAVFLLLGPMDRNNTPGYEPRSYVISASLRPPASSPDERIVKSGRKFTVVNIINRPDQDLTLLCDDGTSIVLTTKVYGSPYGAFGELNITEINYLFEGRVRFLEAKGKQTVDY